MNLGRLFSHPRSSDPVACRHSWWIHVNERHCACTFVRCSRCRVVKKLSRCPLHEAAAQERRPARGYSESMGVFDDGIPQNTSYALELTTALAEMGAPPFAPGTSVLEIGCGIGRLVPWFLKAGIHYAAVEPDPWARRYVRDAYDVPVTEQPWEVMPIEPHSVDLVASIHCLEHTRDADAAFAKMVLAARQHVLVIVPEGSDIWNPDHWWMFTQDVLRTWAHGTDLRLHGPVQKRVAKDEDTIYALFERRTARHGP
jgi:SAM-dependent methyltransferase